MQRLGTTVLYWLAMVVGLLSLIVAAAGIVKSLNPGILRVGSNMIVPMAHAYWKLGIVFAIFSALMFSVAAWLYLRLRRRKPQPPASHF